MSPEKEEIDSPDNSTGETIETASKASKASQRPGGRRTHRACDRCRVKKSKCNGQQPCNTCQANERTCVFSALRRRDIRKWHCRMQDTVDEAIQRLYRACKESHSFPGVLPDEDGGYVTTESILQGMGFTNLDLGPRAAGLPISGLVQMSPLRTDLESLLAQPSPLQPGKPPPDKSPYPQSRSDSASVTSALSARSLPWHADYINIMYPPQQISLHDNQQSFSPTSPITMSDQFQDAMSRHHSAVSYNSPSPLPSQHHYQYPHQFYHRDIQTSALSQHFAQTEKREQDRDTNGHAERSVSPDQKAATSTAQVRAPDQYPEHYLTHQGFGYNGESFISPQQVWYSQSEQPTPTR